MSTSYGVIAAFAREVAARVAEPGLPGYWTVSQDALFGGSAEEPAEDFFHAGSHALLAARMRPRTLDEVVGQDHLLGPGRPLRRLVEWIGGGLGHPLRPTRQPARRRSPLLVSSATDRNFNRPLRPELRGQGGPGGDHQGPPATSSTANAPSTFIDEVHRFSKTQQDALLGAVENRTVLLVAATTENPLFSVVAPAVPVPAAAAQTLDEAAVREVLTRALTDDREARRARQRRLRRPRPASGSLLAGGDARRALTYLEAAAEAAAEEGDEGVDKHGDGAGQRQPRRGALRP
ncbi:hypothetical protein QP028_15035 [Corynebacterium suedekumii]|nr:hypothetical protein QP028_15035 [Corynebacterium suedekumii]